MTDDLAAIIKRDRIDRAAIDNARVATKDWQAVDIRIRAVDDRRYLLDLLRETRQTVTYARVQAKNLGQLIRTDPRIKGTPMALEVMLDDLLDRLSPLSGSEIGSETPESTLTTHDEHNTAGIGTGVDERA